MYISVVWIDYMISTENYIVAVTQVEAKKLLVNYYVLNFQITQYLNIKFSNKKCYYQIHLLGLFACSYS